MVRPVSFKGFQKEFQEVSDFPLGIMCLYQIPQLRGSCDGICSAASP